MNLRRLTEKFHLQHRAKVVFIGVPVIFTLMLLDAACAAWDEFRDDWRDFKGWLADEWRNE